MNSREYGTCNKNVPSCIRQYFCYLPFVLTHSTFSDFLSTHRKIFQSFRKSSRHYPTNITNYLTNRPRDQSSKHTPPPSYILPPNNPHTSPHPQHQHLSQYPYLFRSPDYCTYVPPPSTNSSRRPPSRACPGSTRPRQHIHTSSPRRSNGPPDGAPEKSIVHFPNGGDWSEGVGRWRLMNMRVDGSFERGGA